MRRFFMLVMGLALLLAGPRFTPRVAAQGIENIQLVCPPDITVPNDPGQCGAVVHFAAPTLHCGGCQLTVTCTPPSGSFFSIGANTADGQRTTQVLCQARDGNGAVLAECTFFVTVVDKEPPTCGFCIPEPGTDRCDTHPILVSRSFRGATLSSFPLEVGIGDNCSISDRGFEQVIYTRSDGLSYLDPFPIGTTYIYQFVTDLAGNTSQCSVPVTVILSHRMLGRLVTLAPFHLLASGGGSVDGSGMASVQIDVNYPLQPGDPTRLHALIDLHNVTVTWNGVTYHATNNVEANLTANQLSPISLTVPGQYKFVANGQAAVHSFSLSIPLQALITAGDLTSAGFGAPQLVGPGASGG